MTAARLLGAENVEHITGRPIKEIVHPASWEALKKRFDELNENGTTFFWRKIEKGNVKSLNETGSVFPFVEEKFVRRDGSVVAVEVTATPLTFQDRQAIQIIARNITERKRAEEAQQKSEDSYRRLVERSPESILVIQMDDEIAFANPAAVKLLGAAGADELIGKRADAFFKPDPWDAIVSRIRHLRNKQPLMSFTEQQLFRMDGIPVDVELSASPTVYQGKPAVQVIAHDIGERRQNLENCARARP